MLTIKEAVPAIKQCLKVQVDKIEQNTVQLLVWKSLSMYSDEGLDKLFIFLSYFHKCRVPRTFI